MLGFVSSVSHRPMSFPGLELKSSDGAHHILKQKKRFV